MKLPVSELNFYKDNAAALARLTLINSLVAILVTYVMKLDYPFWINWVFSMCIGFITAGLARILRQLIWRQRKPHVLGYSAVCLMVAPFGVVLGTQLGAAIFSYDMNITWFLHWQHSSTLIALTVVVSAIATWIFWNRLQLVELRAASEAEKARAAAVERQALQTQLQMLQAQIEPHMLFNTLANLQGLIALDPERAQHMLSQLIHFLRATLTNARASSTSLQQEFDLLEAYLELLAIRMGKRLRYQLELAPQLVQQKIAPMLLQPLVENAIKHGLEPKLEGGSVTVRASLKDRFLVLSVSDTGLGLNDDYAVKQSSATSGSQLGNQNLSERLRALYGAEASFSLHNLPEQGCLAEIKIPLNQLVTDTTETAPRFAQP